MYLDNRVYQGSSGKVYPLPFTEQRRRRGRRCGTWQAVHLENRYLRLVVLPELGGRIHIGYDKTTGYDFFYRNNVIKPALVGLAGPWISGGVEFNWPQHHRPATYLPVETTIEDGDDGSVTVWCGDHDPFARMSAQHGVRLRPDSSVIELRRAPAQPHERAADLPVVGERRGPRARRLPVVLPRGRALRRRPRRRALTAFPRADRPYYGVDYPARAADGAGRRPHRLLPEHPGADLVHDRRLAARTSSAATTTPPAPGSCTGPSDALSPGKKQWTWGDAPFGHAWDAQLTDDDGPYIELMAGVYTDNQPDFSWLLPGETKVFSQYWYPIPAIGVGASGDTGRRGARRT